MISFYLIGLPLALVLAFHFNLKIYGIWLGLGVASLTMDIVYLWALKRIDFAEQAYEISIHMHENKENEEIEKLLESTS